ncbi:MAG TPA: helix-turn-helix domain-containing protein [Acidimicrobiales bacterium]|nr:helix-turn-helix domain-containing protein [Acidimicrobiales bacterium]
MAEPSSSTHPGPLWDVEDLATYLKKPAATLYQWHHRGIGPRALKVGRHLRYRPSDIESWLKEHEDQAS